MKEIFNITNSINYDMDELIKACENMPVKTTTKKQLEITLVNNNNKQHDNITCLYFRQYAIISLAVSAIMIIIIVAIKLKDVF